MRTCENMEDAVDFTIRTVQIKDVSFLWDMLYEAAAVAESMRALGKEKALSLPMNQKYVEGWGRPGDAGVIAIDKIERPLGTAWYRLYPYEAPGYGFITPTIPELAIGVQADSRGKGIGRALLQALIELAQSQRYPSLSLSVDRNNPALHLYERCGFHDAGISDKKDTSVTMIRQFSSEQTMSSSQTDLDIPHQRMHNQFITQPILEKPGDMVKRLGAVQAQDYAGAKWALGLRLQHATDNNIEQALNDGTILRTHVLRPTWHFVSPVDIRWMLTLTAPRVNGFAAYYYRKLELDDATFARSNTALANALQGGKQLTRSELLTILEHAGIATDDLRFTHLMMRAELDMIVCSGARRGKQFTYALLDERAPEAITLERNDALAKLTRRYIRSRGPVTLQDYAWWSGLTATDARAGFEMVASEFVHEVIDDKTYWFSSSLSTVQDTSLTAHLLPPYDEYTIAYKDRSAVLNPIYTVQTRNGIFSPIVIMDGRIVGTWKRTFKKNAVSIETNLFTSLDESETRVLTASVERFSAFLDMPVLTDTL